MKIALDLDEVIADFIDSLLKYYKEKKGKLHKRKEFKEYKWWPVWKMSKEDAIKFTDEFHQVHSLQDVKPIKDAVKSINYILKNNEVVVITARPVRFKKKVQDWLFHYFKHNKIKVLHAGDFHKDQAATKAQICKGLGITLIVEDSKDTALECAQAGMQVVLFDNPWNTSLHHKNVHRVKGWSEALVAINSLTNT